MQIEQHINRKSLLDNLSQDRVVLLRLFQIAQISFPKTINSLKIACSEMNHADMKSVLHTIRGSAQNMYFVKLAELAQYLENNYASLQPNEIDGCLIEIDKEWSTLVAIMKDLALNIDNDGSDFED